MCQVLDVSRSGYYDWLNRKPSKRTRKNQQLKKHIARIYWKVKGTYGSPRIHRQLAKEGGQAPRSGFKSNSEKEIQIYN